MYKTNLIFISIAGILIISSLIFYYSSFNNSDSIFFKSSYSYRGVKLNPDNAPALSNLFDSANNNSHNTFTSSSECLKCHSIGIKIKGRIQAPQIAHNVFEYCVSCHVLAKNEK